MTMTVRRAIWAAVLVPALAACAATGPNPTDEPTGVSPGSPTSTMASGQSPTASGQSAVPAPATPTPSRSTAAQARPAGTPGTPKAIATDLPSPWGLAFLPDGRMLVTSRDEGTVRIVTPTGDVDLLRASGNGGAIPGVRHGGEGGLLGVAVPPGWRDGDDIVLYRTSASGNEVVRAALSGTSIGAPRVILGGIPAAGNHNGGRLAFGPDGYLYVTTGDAGTRPNSQDKDSLGGKILRITLEGDPAPGNPNAASPVWSLGHRNVQGIDWDEAGRMYASEFGQNTWDELNLIEAGANYGWPDVEGTGGTERGFTDPLATWSPADASPSGLAVTGDAIYLAALRGQRLWRVPLADGEIGEPESFYDGEFGRLRSVERGPDGALWLLTNNTDGRLQPRPGDDRLLRIELT